MLHRVGLLFFNYHKDGRPNKHQIYVYVVRTVHADKQLTIRDRQKPTFFIGYLYYTTTLSIPTCFSSNRIIARQQVLFRIAYLAIFFI